MINYRKSCTVFSCLLLLVLGSHVSSYAADDIGNTCGIPIVLGNKDIEKHVTSEFDKKSVSYSWIDGVLCADKDSIESVESLLSSVVAQYLKPGNSASLYEPIGNAVKESMEENEIQFKEIHFQGRTYLVWSRKDSEIIESFIRLEREKFIKSQENRYERMENTIWKESQR